MRLKQEQRAEEFLAVQKNFDENTVEYKTAAARLAHSKEDYNSTPEGIEHLKKVAIENPNSTTLAAAKKAEIVRQLQSEALKEKQNGRAEAVGHLTSLTENFLDRDEVTSLTDNAREMYEKYAIKDLNAQKPVSQDTYNKFLSTLQQSISSSVGEPVPAEIQKSVDLLKNLEPPLPSTLKSYSYLPKAIERSKNSLYREVAKISDIQGVERNTAQAYYEAYREQYQTLYANLTPSERPDPPKSWVRGELSQSGYTKNYNSNTLPRDPASLYANYRLRVDPTAIPADLKTSKVIASIDLETAGPEGATGFKPENGRIIEIGVVNYDTTGKEISRYSQLIKPEDAFLSAHGTGAEYIHKISVKDLQNSPSWESVQKEVKKQLEGKTILAQNATFEYDWLSHHLPGFAESKPAVVDTLDMSRKHLDLPNHQLATICSTVGVNYTDGHRALHDADVAGRAFFALNKHVQKLWKSKPARRKAVRLGTIPLQSRWNTWGN